MIFTLNLKEHSMKKFMLVALWAGLWLISSGAAEAQSIVSYYVGVDSRSTPFNASTANGGGAYPDAPNFNRLTLLFHHGNHFHGIGTYAYTGPAASPSLIFSNSQLPEAYQAMPPISLLAGGSGAWATTYRSGLPSSNPQDLEYGNFEFRNVHSLNGVDNTTYNSSGGRWNGLFDAADVHLELVSKTPGLNISFSGGLTDDLMNPGDDFHLGDGDELFSVTPIFWADGSIAQGSLLSATFRLTDETGTFGSSGHFTINFQAVPEPGSGLLLASLSLSVMIRRRRLSIV
jgi:hypothetical protein